jgi:creatinine amidohydrolase/Fe(II)-dependent formamide hydrolase-like protein
VRNSHQSGNYAPGNRQSWKPEFWRRALQYNIARKLEEHISDEVKRQTSQVLVSGHGSAIGLLQIVQQALDSRVGNLSIALTEYTMYGEETAKRTITAIQKREQVQDRDRR